MVATFLLPLLATFAFPQNADRAIGAETEAASGTVYFLAEDSAFEALLQTRLDAEQNPMTLNYVSGSEPGKPDAELEVFLSQRDSLQQSRDASALLLRGGSFMAWYEIAYPKGTVSYLPQVLVDAAKSKKPIYAVGGACAYLGGGVVVPREDLEERQRNPQLPADAPEARVNLDLGPGLMFGSDSWVGSSPERLLQFMHKNQVTRGAYFIGDVAMEFNRTTRVLVVHGPGRLLIFDMTRARVFPRGYRGGRVSSLGAGDHWKVGSAPILMGAEKVESEPRWIAAQGTDAVRVLPRVLEERTQAPTSKPRPMSGTELLQWLERPRAQRTTLDGGAATWTLDWDERAQRQKRSDAHRRRTWLNLPFDCNWRPTR